MIRHDIGRVNNEESLIEIIKQINIKNVIEWIADAWNILEPSTITKSWNAVFFFS